MITLATVRQFALTRVLSANGRVGVGVRGITLENDDEVVGMLCIEPESNNNVLVLSENGYGKRTDLEEIE